MLTGAVEVSGALDATVIGCGHVSRVYLPTLVTSADVRVVAVCDADSTIAQARADEFGVGTVFTGVERCLRDQPSHLAVNLTPPTQHAAVTMSALWAGRHVYSEKPLAMTLPEAREIVRTARAARRHVAAAPHVRGSPVVRALREVVRGGEIGLVHTVSVQYGAASRLSRDPASWRYDCHNGGALFDLGVYPVALLLSVFGSARRVTMHSDVLRARIQEGLGTRSVQDFAPDNAVLTIDFGQGTCAVIQTGFWYGAWGFEMRAELLGDAGAVRIAQGNLMADAIEVRSPATGGAWQRRQLNLRDYHWAGGPVALARDIRRGASFDGAAEALRVLYLLTAATEAATDGRWVRLSADPASP